ncbi:MAG: hypothetical protein LR011_08620 [Verrucomicrobia bacterium]|nr:hypothetical protein [Verrucomicrobiota bacterium]
MKRSVRQLFRGVFILILLSVTVPWGADGYMSGTWGLLPVWVWYALLLNVVFAVVVCFLFERWWAPESIPAPDDEDGGPPSRERQENVDLS